MSYAIYMYIKGKQSGEVVGFSSNKDHAKWIEVLGFEHAMHAPMDLGQHQASGRVQCGVVKVRKPIDVATPVLFQALSTRELLTEVKFEFWGAGSTKVGSKYLDITLNDAVISKCSMNFWPDRPTLQGSSDSKGEILNTQVIEIGYQKIAWSATSFDITGLKVAGPKTAEVSINQF